MASSFSLKEESGMDWSLLEGIADLGEAVEGQTNVFKARLSHQSRPQCLS